MPALAAMPERGARMPILTGPACAMAGANTPPGSASALALAMDFNTLRREIVMACSLVVRFVCKPTRARARVGIQIGVSCAGAVGILSAAVF